MRFFGLVALAVGAAGVAYSVGAIDRRGRPADVAVALLAPIAAVIALVGLTLLFVPEFL